MKIIHTADLHMDSPLTSRLSHTAIAGRKRELLSTFRRIIEDGEKRGAEAMIIAGDLFDSEEISARAIEYVSALIRSHPKMLFFYLPGNHEKRGFLPYAEELVNLKIFPEGFGGYTLGDVTIVGCSENSENMFDALTLDPAQKNIVVLHGEVREGRGGEINLSMAKNRGIDYIALGHYHTYREYRLDERGIAVYAGTPEGRGFDECGRGGYVLIDTDRIQSPEFIPIASRVLHIVEVDMTGYEGELEAEGRVSVALAEIPECDLVRVRLSGKVAPGDRPNLAALRERFNKRYYHFEIEDAIRTELDIESLKHDISLKGEFIRLTLAREDLSEKERERILDCGLSALSGEEWMDKQ